MGVVPVDQHGHAERRHEAHGVHFDLLPDHAGSVSRLHRIRSDEVWNFHLGGPMTVLEIAEDGALTKTVLGPDVLAGHKVQHVVKAGTWFGSYPCDGTAFSFVGCGLARV